MLYDHSGDCVPFLDYFAISLMDSKQLFVAYRVTECFLSAVEKVPHCHT